VYVWDRGLWPLAGKGWPPYKLKKAAAGVRCILAASRLPLQLFGTPFLWPFAVVSPLTVFGANSKLSSITLLSGLLNAPPHPAPQIRRVSHRHCALYKFTYILTYLRKCRRKCRNCQLSCVMTVTENWDISDRGPHHQYNKYGASLCSYRTAETTIGRKQTKVRL